MATDIKVHELKLWVQAEVLLTFEAAAGRFDNGQDAHVVVSHPIEVAELPGHPPGVRRCLRGREQQELTVIHALSQQVCGAWRYAAAISLGVLDPVDVNAKALLFDRSIKTLIPAMTSASS